MFLFIYKVSYFIERLKMLSSKLIHSVTGLDAANVVKLEINKETSGLQRVNTAVKDVFTKNNFWKEIKELSPEEAADKFRNKFSKSILSNKLTKDKTIEDLIKLCSPDGVPDKKMLAYVSELIDNLGRQNAYGIAFMLDANMRVHGKLDSKKLKKIVTAYKYILKNFSGTEKLPEGAEKSRILRIAINVYDNPQVAQILYSPAAVKHYNPMYGIFIPNSKKAAQKINDEIMRLLPKDDKTKFEIARNSYDKRFCDISKNTTLSDRTIEEITSMDKNGDKVITTTRQKFNSGITIEVEKNKLKNKVVYKKYGTNHILQEQKIKIYDRKGKLVRTEIMKSTPVEGNFDIFYQYPDGRVEIAARAFKDPTSNEQVVKHNLESNSGIQTKAKYETLANGDTKSEYQITGQDGKIISRQRASRKQIDDNHYITTKNGVSYDVQFTENQVIVTKIKNGELSSEQVTFKIGNAGEDDVIFDKTLTPMLKQLSGDEFFAIKKNDIQKIVMDNKVRGNAYWNKFDKKLVVSPELQDKLSVLKHELGHSKDMPGYLEEVIDLKKQRMTVNDGTALYSHNQKFNKVFADELKEFDEKATISEKVALDYFISQRPFSSSGTFEVLAEANALQSSIQDLPQIAERTVNLERHFPKSLAQAFEYLNQTAKKIKGYVIKDNDSPYLHS